MRPIRSATLAVLTSIALVAPLTGCQSLQDDQPVAEILIAADLELSGAAASIGAAYQRALELKVEQLNESGALGNRQIRLKIKDNRSDPTESLRNIGEFTADPMVHAIIMGSCNECAIGATKTINDSRVPTIALAPATDVAIPVAQRRYMFKLAPNAIDDAAALVTELKEQGLNQVSLVYTDDPYGRDGLAAMTDELRKAGIELVGTARVQSTDTDVSDAVAALTADEPDAIVAWTSAEQATLVARYTEESGYPGQLFFDAAAAGDLFFESAAAKSVDGTTMVFTPTMVIDDTIATTPAKAARKQWFRAYTARFGGYYGLSSFAADAIQLLADASLRGDGADGTMNRDGMRDVLETSQVDGLSGPIRMTPDNHSGLMPQALTILVATGGRWRLAG